MDEEQRSRLSKYRKSSSKIVDCHEYFNENVKDFCSIPCSFISYYGSSNLKIHINYYVVYTLIYQLIQKVLKNTKSKGEKFGIEIGVKIEKQNPLNPGTE